MEDFATPAPQNENEVLVSVKAVAVKNLDKLRASGAHYSTKHETWTARVVGSDGVALLADGTRVYGIGVRGMLGEKAVIEKDKMVALPAGITDAVAAALPNAVMGSALAMRFRAGLTEGETVLINGATGVTGRMAVQLAKHYGAKKVVATGRNEQSLRELLTLGADEIVSLTQAEENFAAQIKNGHRQDPVDVIIDFLWGRSAELLLSSLSGNGGFSHCTRFVTVGGMTGDTISLSSSILRSTDIRICGSGLGTWTAAELGLLISEILPEMFRMTAEGRLKIETETVALKDIEPAWKKNIASGKRLVVLV